jgi:pimeloyl-ACP methyl ester carboxylesterase
MATVRVDGAELYYEERGHGDPVLWLQGLGADHTAWSPQLTRFSAWYRCIAPDNRGAGRSAPGGAFTLHTLADDALSLLDARAPDAPVHVIGLSMGASIAQEIALRAPDRVRSLVLVSASAYIEPRIQELLEAWRAIYPRVSPREFQRQANCWLFSWRFFERAGAAAGVIAYAERQSPPPEWFLAQIAAARDHDTRDRLARLAVPTLVLSGAEDAMTPPRLGRDLAARIPGAEYAEISDAGHSLNLEQQRAFNEAVLAFLAAH